MRSKINITVLFFVIFIYALRNYLFSTINSFPFGTDSFGHLFNAIRFNELLANLLVKPNLQNLDTFLYYINIIIGRPPFYYFLVFFLNLLISNLLFVQLYLFPTVLLGIIIVYTFKISELLAKNSGIFSVLFLAISPAFFKYSWGIDLYFMQSALVCVSFYYLLKSRFFYSRNYSIIFGFIFGLGMISKEQFSTYFIVPSILFFYISFSRKKKFNYKNAFLALLAFFCSGVSFFVLQQIKGDVAQEFFCPEILNVKTQLWEYFLAFIGLTSIPLFLFFLYSAFLMIRKKKVYFLLILSSVLGLFMIYPFFKVGGRGYHDYYISAYLPFMSIVSGVVCWKNKTVFIKVFFIFMLSLHVLFYAENYSLPYLYRSDYTLQIADYIEKHIVKKRFDLKYGIIAEEKNFLLCFELPVLLKYRGCKGLVGDFGFPNLKIYTFDNEFDFFIYVANSKTSFWPSKDILRQQALLFKQPLENYKIIENDIERIFKAKNALRLVAVFPYQISRDSELFYVNILKKK